MGHSIAVSAALPGLEVKVWAFDEQDRANGQRGISEKLAILEEHEVIDKKQQQQMQAAIDFSLSLEAVVQDASFIIEAVPEKLELKQNMFIELERLCSKDAILASNTSGLSPTEISQHIKHPERAVITHFWNPGHLIPLVEIVRGEHTSDETVERSLSFLKTMNKKPVVLEKDVLGSIVNRLQYALFREAQFIMEQGVASVEDIDDAVRYSIGRRLSVTGPFMTADMGGLDVFRSISDYLFEDLSTHQESLPYMKNLVDSGKYGQKTGEGFYQWDSEQSLKMNEARERELIYWLNKDLKE